jgi:hypothetical protein
VTDQHSTVDLSILAPEREVVVVEAEHHQLVLAGYAPAPGEPPRRLVAELVRAPVTVSPWIGRPGVEVRIDGGRVGELTYRTAQDYLPTWEVLMTRGERVGCRALVKYGRHGLVEVELRLPPVRQAPVAAPPLERPARARVARLAAGAVLAVLAMVVLCVLGMSARSSSGSAVPAPAPLATPGDDAAGLPAARPAGCTAVQSAAVLAAPCR